MGVDQWDPAHRREDHTGEQRGLHHSYLRQRMTGRGETVVIAAAHTFPNLPDNELCSSAYPAPGVNFESLCHEADNHPGDHRALAVVAGSYRRYVVWAQDGTVLPDEETSPARPQGQTPPSEGDQVT